MPPMNPLNRYLVEEFYDDYREGVISRRTFIRRIAFIAGGMAAAVPIMTALGCSPDEVPDPTEPIPEPDTPAPAATIEPTEAPAAPTSSGEPQSPYSVPADDPGVVASVINLQSQGDEIFGYLARPAEDGVYPGVLVCHENRGLTPHIEDVARRFAKAGYVALALDLLAREGGTPANDRDEIPGLLTDAGEERHIGDFVAGYDYLQGLEEVDGERIAMNGYCFGGGITWRTATVLTGLKAAAPFYGPGPDLQNVPNIQAAMLGVYAEMDDRVNAGKDDLDAALTAAGVTHQMNVYPGVGHAFHNDTGDRYDETQASQAWNDMLDWFGEHV